MDLNTLATNLRSQASAKSTVELDDEVFPDVTLASIRAAFALDDGKNLIIAGVTASDIPDPVDGVLTIKAGTTSVLKQTNVPVGLTFTASGGALEVVVVTDMADGWEFNKSFAGLDTFPFNKLETPHAHFVYSSAQHSTNYTGPDGTIPLEPGLNFLSRVTFKHLENLNKLLGALITDPSLKFYGALDIGHSLPVGTLRAPLGVGPIKVGVDPLALTLDNPAVAVRVGTATEDDPVQQIDLLVETTTFQNALQVAVGVPVTGGAFEISVTPPKNGASMDALIKKLPGGQTFNEYIPEELHTVFDHIGLKSYSMIVAPEPKVNYVGLSISTSNPWTVIEDVLTLEHLSLEIETIDPKGLNWSRAYFNATAKFLPKLPNLFPGELGFKVQLEKHGKWQVSAVSGAYYGSVSLGELVKELLNTSVPPALNDIVFSDFGVRAERQAPGSGFSYSFAGRVEAAFPILDTHLASSLHLVVNTTTNGYKIDLGGSLLIGEQAFTFTLDVGQGNSKFDAQWQNNGTPLGIGDIASAFGWDSMPTLPEGLDLGLKKASFTYDFKSRAVKLTAESTNYGQIVFASLVPSAGPNQDKRVYLFSLDPPLSLKFNELPVVGEHLPKDMGLEKLQIIGASAALDKKDLTELKSLIGGKAEFPALLSAGLTLAATFKMGDGDSRQVVVPLTAKSVQPEPLPHAATTMNATALTAAAYGSDAKWLTLNKTLGPVYLDKVGVQYQDSTLRFLLNAALSAAGLTLSVDGLSAGSPLTQFKPEFSLSGLGIDYKNEAVEIGGALIRTGPDSYDGTAVIKTKQFALSALGSYAKIENQPSLFIYAFLDYPLGGPAFFFVTGLAAGFGYNRRLIPPSVDKVAEFPLVKQATGREAAPSGVMKALESLRKDVPPSVGDIFLALGVRFNSFKLVDSFALLTFEFGNRFVVNLLGLSTAVVPTPETGKNVTPLAKLQIAWKATYNPDEGCLGIDARLTPNSYILSKDCHLSGGYAFYSWFTGDHAGDFVQTLGGYHPDFEKNLPAHYPKVPRLAFDWRVSNSLTIQGDAYYALTGSALMAGGHLEVLFREGELRAWLRLGADFLIAWKPYHYDARLSVNVGASYTFDINLLFGHVRVTISVDVGADLHLWGPDFSGTAHIDISVISFTIAFGAGASRKPAALKKWSEFQESFLPQKNVCSISVQDGLIRKVEEDGKERWIINPKDFSLLVNSAIPFKHAFSKKNDNEDLVLAGANVGFGVRPMAVSPNDLNSTLNITVKRETAAADGELKYEVIKKTVPKGLWEGVLDGDITPDLDPKAFLNKVPSGIEIKPAAELGAGASATINLDVFKYSEASYYQGDDPSKEYAFNWEIPGGFTLDKQDAETRRKKIEAEVASNPARAALLKDLDVAVTVSMRGNIVAGDFMSAPQIGKL
jgi:hypothetical protein